MAVFGTFKNWVHQQKELVRVGITAAIGTLLAWLTYEVIYFLNGIEPRATISWVLAFVVGIFRQHHLYRTLSFPDARVPYGISLRREAVASLAIFAASTALNYSLTERLNIHHRMAWAACLASVAVLDYTFMKFFVFKSLKSSGSRQ